MSMRHKSLFVTLLIISVASFFWGCSQSDDVVTPIYKTDIYLSPERLPDNPPGMIYTLWAANGETGDTVYIGKFGYNSTEVKFYDENSQIRADSNYFALETDLFSYTNIFISIDTIDFETTDPGPIMLLDDVSDPMDDPMNLIFPESDSLWEATVRFNMETTSDNNRYTYDGCGIWFTNYQSRSTYLQDTFALTGFTLDSIILFDIGDKTDTISIKDTANYSIDTVEVILGLDTFELVKANFDFVMYNDVDSPWVVYQPDFTYSLGTQYYVEYDDFTQDDFGLIDYSAYGWKYKGWVVSPVIDPAAFGELTPPAWLYNTVGDSIIPGEDGGLLTTGTFTDITKGDDSNPYAIGTYPRIPDFPGEDFLRNLPGGLADNLNLVPNTEGNSGTIFITLEPENYVFDSTNFPLLVMICPIPEMREEVTSDSTFTMTGWMMTNDPWHGFPEVNIRVVRH